jgi:hypothetical protein
VVRNRTIRFSILASLLSACSGRLRPDAAMDGTDASAESLPGGDAGPSAVDGGAGPPTVTEGDSAGGGADSSEGAISTPIDAESYGDSGEPGDDDSGDAALGTSCAGIPAWSDGTEAPAVVNFGEKYTCVVFGWCSLSGAAAVAAFEPGKGSDWQQAWMDDGPCVEDAGGP